MVDIRLNRWWLCRCFSVPHAYFFLLHSYVYAWDTLKHIAVSIVFVVVVRDEYLPKYSLLAKTSKLWQHVEQPKYYFIFFLLLLLFVLVLYSLMNYTMIYGTTLCWLASDVFNPKRKDVIHKENRIVIKGIHPFTIHHLSNFTCEIP